MKGLVLGGGLAATLAAAALAEHCDLVTVVERDRMPSGPVPRKGVPQGRHVHNLMSEGARAMNALLPGVIDTLLAAGGRRLDVPRMLVSYAVGGWNQRFPGTQYFVCASRPLLDWTVRQQVLAGGGVEFVEGTDVVGLCGGADRITGATVRDRETQQQREIHADFVVDATGRNSSTPKWLADLGLPSVALESFGPGIAYASRHFQTDTDDFPLVSVNGDPNSESFGTGGVLMPVEGGRWIVTLGGIRGNEPPTDEEGYLAFARNLPHPLLADLMTGAKPLGPVYGYRIQDNRRYRYDRLEPWPEGFVVVGDAASAFNPVYGHGMSVAARNALALRNGLRRLGWAAGTARAVQRSVTSGGLDAWQLAVGQDSRYLAKINGAQPSPVSRLWQAYLDRMARSARRSRTLLTTQLDVFTLSAPAKSMLSPRAVYGTLRGPDRPALEDPPLTVTERSLLG